MSVTQEKAAPHRWKCETCGTRYAEYVNGCPHCWEAGIRSGVTEEKAAPPQVVEVLCACGHAHAEHYEETPHACSLCLCETFDLPSGEIAHLRAVNKELLEALEVSEAEHDAMAVLLDAWARESVEGSWSTHQVDAMRRRADVCRKFATSCRRAIAKARGRQL